MRNLKKILAVITVVAMLATMSVVPALAAGFTYETEAETLNELKLMEGMNLGDPVTRIVGLTLAIKAAGLKDEVDAMTDEEVAEILENVVDADELPAWSLKWTAYAVENGYTSGTDATIAPKVKFSADQTASSNEVLYWVLKIGMGYEDVVPGTANTDAINAGALSLAQAIDFGTEKNPITRDDVAGILYQACESGVNADGVSFIQSLIDAGFITEDAAADAGFVAPPSAAPIAVDSVYAENLKEVVVEFDGAVDKDSLDKGDFDIDGIVVDSVELQDDDVTVLVKLTGVLDNETSYDITIKEVTGVNGKDVEETELSFEAKDYELPIATDIEFTGPQTAKITFSEPVSSANSSAAGYEISVDNGIYLGTVGSWDGSSISVDFGTELSEEAHSILVKNFADYVPYTMISKTFNVVYADVDSDPVASIKEAKQEFVKIEFDRPVKGIKVDNFYQTYSSWKPLEILDTNGVGVNESDYYSEVKLVFSKGVDADRPIPVGSTNVVVVGDKLQDRWGNKISSDVFLAVSVTSDTTAPVLNKITVEAQDEIKLYFSEDLNATEATKESNYKIVNPDGDTLKSYDFTATYSSADDEYVVTIKFDSAQDPGEYTITISGIKDKALAANTMGDTTESFDVTDKVAIDLTKVKVTAVEADHILYVKYPEAVAVSGTGSALNKDNYLWDYGSGEKTLPDGCKLSMFTNKIVKIQFPATIKVGGSDVTVDLVGDMLTIGRVADLVDNMPSAFSWTSPAIAEEAAPIVTAIKKTDENKYELTIDQELKSVKASGIKITINTATTADAIDVAAISYVNDGDKTKIKVTVKAEMKDAGTLVLTGATAYIETTSDIKGVTGKTMGNVKYYANGTLDGSTAPVSGRIWADGMAPKLADDHNTANDDNKLVYAIDAAGTAGKIDRIIIGYSESLKANSISKYTYEVGGYDVLAAGLLSGDWATVKSNFSGTAFDTTGSYVMLIIKEIDGDGKTDTDATPSVTQKLDIEDVAGNKLAPQDGVEAVCDDIATNY